MMEEPSESIQFSDALRALSDMNTPFPARYLRSFSDLSRRNLKELMALWPTLPEERKISFLEDLEEVMESDTLVSYDDIARILLTDPNPAVRVIALRLLWECEETTLISELLDLTIKDEDEAVRAAATSVLGKYILLGELEAISSDLKKLVEERLLEIVVSSDHARVKQRALESLGYSSHPDVTQLIQNAFQSTDPTWVMSALFAMGRSADESWAPQVESMLASPEPEVQFEAIRAAGELELSSSREKLLSLLEDGIEDEEIRLALIWSLSQIGGEEVKEKLDELLANAIDADEIEWIEKAIENLELSTSGSLELLEFSPDKDDEFDLDDDESFDWDDADFLDLNAQYDNGSEDDEEDEQ